MNFNRQYKIVDVDSIPPIGIIGAGSIGSWVALVLSKMGAKDITVWDFDIIEPENGPNQIYKVSDNGRPKVEALRDIISEHTGNEIKINMDKYDGTNKEIIISGVDDITIRKDIFNSFIDMNMGIKLYIDGRMGGELSSIFIVDPMDIDSCANYKGTLFDKSQAEELECGMQSVVYNNTWIASFIANQVKLYTMKQYDNMFDKVHMSWGKMNIIGRRDDKNVFLDTV